MAKIHQQIIKIMAEVGHIAKDRKNAAQGYAFRGIDDVYAALQPVMAKHGVFSVPTVLEEHTEERTTKSGSNLIYRVLKIRYDFYAEDGSFVSATVIGEGMDSGDKAANKAMSVADKYACLQVFKIPTEEAKDPENDSHDVASKGKSSALFDPKDLRHKGWLARQFRERGLPADRIDEVAEALKGLPDTDFDAVLHRFGF